MTLYRLGERSPHLPEGDNYYIAPGATVIGHVSIGAGASIWFNAVLRGDNEPIVVGEGANIQDCAVVHTDPGYPVEIGDDVTIGHGAIIHGCRIGKGSLIGMGATILNGAIIGAGCLVGANALVREGMLVPDGSLVLGVPAQVVRQLDSEASGKLAIAAARYREKAQLYPIELVEVG